MKCDTEFCIYQRNGDCSLDEISIDNMGTCEDCILVNINKEELQDKKDTLLDEYEKDWL